MNKVKINIGNPEFFLALFFCLILCSMLSRISALVGIISFFGSGGVALAGLIVSIVQWNKLKFLGKLFFYILLLFAILWVIAILILCYSLHY